MAPKLSEGDIGELIYNVRGGDAVGFDSFKKMLLLRENVDLAELLEAAVEDWSGNGVLHMAAANGYHTILRDICREMSHPTPQNPCMLAVLNAQNFAGNTPLHWAALNGHLEVVKVLLDEGADPTITNQRGHDAVYEAELNDKMDVVEWVLKEGGEGLQVGFGRDSAEEEADESAMDGVDCGVPQESSGDLEKKMKGMDLKDSMDDK